VGGYLFQMLSVVSIVVEVGKHCSLLLTFVFPSVIVISNLERLNLIERNLQFVTLHIEKCSLIFQTSSGSWTKCMWLII
jgi:hypothetical protein